MASVYVLHHIEGNRERKVGVCIKSTLITCSVQQLAIAFVDDNDFVSDGKKAAKKWRKY